ncbi:DUF2165 family protein [Rickettsiales bacterium LUAb2]
MYFLQAQILSKSILAFFLACFGLIVGIDNIIDYNTNYQFVYHVLRMDSMETFFSNSPALVARAIHSTVIYKIFYALIILGELITGLLFLAGSVLLFINIFNNNTKFIIMGKICCIFGGITAIAIWYFGFAVVGGEYFSMWANTFTGQMKAYTFVTFILIALIYISIKEYSYTDKS